MSLSPSFIDRLLRFIEEHDVKQPGSLGAMIGITDKAASIGTGPFQEADFKTKGGAVSISGARIRKILSHHGEDRLRMSEFGRTSRGNLARLPAYLEILSEFGRSGDLDFESIEVFWVKKVGEYLDNEPLEIRNDASKSLSRIVKELVKVAKDREKARPGTNVLGTVLEHLVGAKLEITLEEREHVEHKGASVSDMQHDRPGDFIISDTAIHVTTFPGELLIQKCGKNLSANLRPIIVTLGEWVDMAEHLCDESAIGDHVEIIDAVQFIATNVYEWSSFSRSVRTVKVNQLISVYNRIVEETEGDPTYRIQIV